MTKISFIGDVFPANMSYHVGSGIASLYAKKRERFDAIKNFFRDTTLVFANLESPLIDDTQTPQNKAFAGSQRFTDLLKECKINIVTISNNHILEHGIDGFNSTLKHLEDNNISYVGRNKSGLSNIVEMQIDDIKICFASFNAIHDITIPDTYSVLTQEAVIQTLTLMEEYKPDYKIIGLHWGNEYINIPSYEQIAMAHKFIDNGADIIVGHHPHVIQPVEKYKEGLIFYSLGNFLFDMNYAENIRLGMIAHVKLHKTKQIEYELVPIYLGQDYIPDNFKDNFKFQSILNHYTRLKDGLIKSPEDYIKYYTKQAKKHHVRQRLLMKKDLLTSVLRFSPESRRLFFKILKKKLW